MTPAAPPTDPVGRILFAISRALAVLGGFVLIAMIIVTVYDVVSFSIFGRAFPGAFELAAYGMVVSVFLFLPYGQMVRAHVIVDVFTMRAPRRWRSTLDAAANLLFAAFAALLAWRMVFGGIDMFNNGQTTALLKIAFWWSFPLAVVCLAVMCAACLHTAWRDLRAADAL